MNKFTQYRRRDGRMVTRDTAIEREQVSVTLEFRGNAYGKVFSLKWLLENPNWVAAIMNDAIQQLYEGAMDGQIQKQGNDIAAGRQS